MVVNETLTGKILQSLAILWYQGRNYESVSWGRATLTLSKDIKSADYWLLIQFTLAVTNTCHSSANDSAWFGGKKIAPTWNCSQQGPCIILSVWVLIYGKRLCRWVFLVFFGAVNTRSSVPSSAIIIVRRQTPLQPISPNISTSLQLTPKQCRWINSTPSKRKRTLFENNSSLHIRITAMPLFFFLLLVR